MQLFQQLSNAIYLLYALATNPHSEGEMIEGEGQEPKGDEGGGLLVTMLALSELLVRVSAKGRHSDRNDENTFRISPINYRNIS